MKFTLLICLFFMAGMTGFSQRSETTWTALPKPYPRDNLASTRFISEAYGYVVGNSQVGVIMQTKDGGTTWNKFYGNPPNPIPPVFSVFCTDSVHICAVGSNFGSVSFIGGSISLSSSGGNSWSYQLINSIYNLYAVFFPSLEIGYATGRFGTIIKTKNGGESWAKQSSGTEAKLTSIFFTDTLVGYITCSENYILKTTNGGANWSIISIPSLSKTMNSVHFTDANTGYIAGNKGIILKTTDAGMNWTQYLVDSITDNLYSIWFTSPNHGYICGEYGLMLETQDAGATWSWSRPGGSDALYSVHFPTPETGYAVGANGRITKAHVTWGTSSGGNLPEVPKLNIYPNPARDQAFIELPPDARRGTLFTLTITDVIGKQVEKQVSADPDGVIALTLGQFSKGLYVLKLEQGQNHYAGKLRIE